MAKVTYEAVIVLDSPLPNGRQHVEVKNIAAVKAGKDVLTWTNKRELLKVSKDLAMRMGAKQIDITKCTDFGKGLVFDKCEFTTYSYYESVNNITAWWNEDKDYPARKFPV